MVQDLQPDCDWYRYYLATTQEGTPCAPYVHAQAQSRHGQCGPDGVCLEEGEIYSTITGQPTWKDNKKATFQDSRTEEVEEFGHRDWLYDILCIRACLEGHPQRNSNNSFFHPTVEIQKSDLLRCLVQTLGMRSLYSSSAYNRLHVHLQDCILRSLILARMKVGQDWTIYAESTYIRFFL